MTVTLGHFDIWDIWNLQVFWKMTVLLLVHRGNWWELRKNAPKYLSEHGYTRQHYQNTPGHFTTPPGIPNTLTDVLGKALATSKHSSDSLRGIWFGRDVREDSGRNECVSWCLLSVRNICECLGLPLTMSRICQGRHGSVRGYLRV